MSISPLLLSVIPKGDGHGASDYACNGSCPGKGAFSSSKHFIAYVSLLLALRLFSVAEPSLSGSSFAGGCL